MRAKAIAIVGLACLAASASLPSNAAVFEVTVHRPEVFASSQLVAAPLGAPAELIFMYDTSRQSANGPGQYVGTFIVGARFSVDGSTLFECGALTTVVTFVSCGGSQTMSLVDQYPVPGYATDSAQFFGQLTGMGRSGAGYIDLWLSWGSITGDYDWLDGGSNYQFPTPTSGGNGFTEYAFIPAPGEYITMAGGGFATSRRVPEPGTLTLLGIGLLGLAFTRRESLFR